MEEIKNALVDTKKSAGLAHELLLKACSNNETRLLYFSVLVAKMNISASIEAARIVLDRAKEEKQLIGLIVGEIHLLIGAGKATAEMWELVGVGPQLPAETKPEIRGKKDHRRETREKKIREQYERLFARAKKLLDEFARVLTELISIAGNSLDKESAIQAKGVLKRLEACKHS